VKNMTKRDVADIVLAVIGFIFILRFLYLIVYIGGILSTPDSEYFNRILTLQLHLASLLILFIVSYLLLFKRDRTISLIFPQADKIKLAMGKEFVNFSRYVFWIKLVGITKFLFSGIQFVAGLASSISVKGDRIISHFWWYKSGPELFSAILAIIVIWKAEWIARFIEEIGQPGKTKGTK
jgi:hypothetical protein